MSKNLETNYGKIVPYAGLPFGIVAGPKKNTFPCQFMTGAEWFPIDSPVSILAELGLNLNEASSYVSAGVLYFLPE